MNVFVAAILLAGGLAVPAVDSAATVQVEETAMPAVAAKLIPDYASARKPADLIVLYRLQLAAGRFAETEMTLGRLETAYRSSEPRLVPTLVPWRIYARAKAYEARGIVASEALTRAFSELYGS